MAPAASTARARCSALLTEATVAPSSSATSAAVQPSTSRRISTARCRGASRCSTATKASFTDSRWAATSAGSPVSGSTRPSGAGPIQVTSDSWVSCAVATVTGPARSIGRARALRPFSASRQTLVAMRYSQERSADRPSKPRCPRQARTMVSCTASSASKTEPSIR